MINAIITGSTGMVGRGVLLECLDSREVDKVLVVNRRPIDLKHEKLKEIIHGDFLDIDSIKEDLSGYNACFFCMGVSALGLSEPEYTRLTYDLTRKWAESLYEINPDLVFNYVSGQGTDETGKSRQMWARIKGKTENMVLETGFRDAYAFRPGIILPRRGVKSSTGWYNGLYTIMRPFFPLLQRSNSVTDTEKVGRAMIRVVRNPMEKKRLDNQDINHLAKA